MKKEYMHLAAEANGPAEAFERLSRIIAILRKECPWDRKQTHESLKSCLIEEAYEVIEAIEKKDPQNLEEELGDVLLQVVFHVNLAEEENLFDMTSVINRECEKMIRRHPHVFLEEKSNKDIKSIDKVLEKWENIKAEEKGTTSVGQILADVPHALPALTRAAKIQKKAADAGFDWDDVSGAMDKIREETAELTEAKERRGDLPHITEELGDLLFSVVNASRFLKVDPEEALRMSTEKFIRRFNYIEEKSLACGRLLTEMSLDEMDKLWEEAKSLEVNHTINNISGGNLDE